jgi:multiple sugar transport system substrate-binding protein
MLDLVADNVAVVEALGEESAVVVGHDWGATIAAVSALTRPDVFRAVGLLGVPYTSPGGTRPSEVFARMGGDEEFYVSYFQQPGRAEAEIEPDVRGWLAGFHAALSADTLPAPGAPDPHFVSPGGTLRERFPTGPLPAWLGEGDLDFLAGEFERTGMTGALNRYRNMDRDWADLAGYEGAPITQPSLFIGGALDASLAWPAVKTDFQTCQSFWEKFQTQAAGGNPPDVFQNAVTFLRKYDKRGILLDLKSRVETGNLTLDHFRDGVTKVGEVDGKQLGIPVGSNTMALVIDKKVFQKAGVEPHTGWTRDDYFKALKTVHDKTKVPGDTGYFAIMCLYDLYLRQNGKAFFTEDGLGFGQADLTECWTDGYNRVKAGIVTDPKVVSQESPKSSLSAGHGAAEFTWDNFTVRCQSEGDSEYGLAPIPTTDGKRTGQYLASLMLSAASSEQYAAYRPADAVNKEIAQYEEDTAKAGVLGTITPHPSGADTTEAAFLRIGGDLGQGKTKVADAVKQFFTESEAAFQA